MVTLSWHWSSREKAREKESCEIPARGCRVPSRRSQRCLVARVAVCACRGYQCSPRLAAYLCLWRGTLAVGVSTSDHRGVQVSFYSFRLCRVLHGAAHSVGSVELSCLAIGFSFINYFRQKFPNATSFPQFFKQQPGYAPYSLLPFGMGALASLLPCVRGNRCPVAGLVTDTVSVVRCRYLALGAGKLYHTSNPPDHDEPLSWSPEANGSQGYFEPAWQFCAPPESTFCVNDSLAEVRRAQLRLPRHPHVPPRVPRQQHDERPMLRIVRSLAGLMLLSLGAHPSYTTCDLSPSMTASQSHTIHRPGQIEDETTLSVCIGHLRRVSRAGKKGYVGCGFHRPHAPYISTSDAWGKHVDHPTTSPRHPLMAEGVPRLAQIVNFGIGLEVRANP